MEPVNNPEGNDAYKVVIFHGATAKPFRFSFSRSLLSKVLIIGLILLIIDLLIVSHYVIRTSEFWELTAFHTNALSAREQVENFSVTVDDLRKRLVSMQQLNQQLRVMLGIETPKTEDPLNGQGGLDLPILQDHLPSPLGKAFKSEASGLFFDSMDLPQVRVTSIAKTIDWLSTEITVQEALVQKLSLAAKQKSSRWAATPSIWPVKGWVTSRFGSRISPFTQKPTWHDGLDIGAAVNAPVYASAHGRVTMVTRDAKLGNLLKIDHGFGIETLYGHLAKVLVKEGQRVMRGEVIALVGNTGVSTGPHLHYMVKIQGETLDPATYILE